MRADSRGALASVCWHCSMQSDGTAVRSYIVGWKICFDKINIHLYIIRHDMP